MQRNSVLPSNLVQQRKSIPELPKEKKQCWQGKYRFCFIGIVIGILVGGTPVTVLLTLYVKKLMLRATTTTTVGITPTLRWQAQGVTVAGTTGISGTGLNQLDQPKALAIDSYNSLYVTDTYNHRVLKFLSGASSSTVVAGQALGTPSSSAFGLSYPRGIAVDQNSSVYIADTNNNRIQLWPSGSSTGITVAGNSTVFGSGAGLLFSPYSVTLNSNAGLMYIADTTNQRIMSWVPGASTGTLFGGNGGGNTIIQVNTPSGLYFDSLSNSLLITNYDGNTAVRWVLGIGSWTLVGGNITGSSGNSSTLLYRPEGLTVDPMGNIYVADTYNHRIQLFLNGQTTGITIAGSTSIPGSNSTLFNLPYGVALDSQLNLYVVDSNNHRVQKFFRY